MIQIIGKGGFGREVSCYCDFNSIDNWSYEKEEVKYIKPNQNAVIAIGDEEVRRQIVDEFIERQVNQSWGVLNFGKNYDNRNIISDGCIICPETILTTGIEISDHCIININCTIGHDTKIGSFVTINPGVNISGNVTIGSNCNIGSNTVIRNGVTICDDVVIGAGCVVVKDITDAGTYVGNPAVRMDLRQNYLPVTYFENWVENTFNPLQIFIEGNRQGIVRLISQSKVDSASINNAPPKPKK